MARQFLPVPSHSAASLNLKRKEETEKETDVNSQILFAQYKCLWHRLEFIKFFCTESKLEDVDASCEP